MFHSPIPEIIAAVCAVVGGGFVVWRLRNRRDHPSQSDLEYWLEDDEAEDLRKSVRRHNRKRK